MYKRRPRLGSWNLSSIVARGQNLALAHTAIYWDHDGTQNREFKAVFRSYEIIRGAARKACREILTTQSEGCCFRTTLPYGT